MIIQQIEVDELRTTLLTAIKEEVENFKYRQPESEVLLTRKQTADFLSVTLVTLNEWTKLGLIKSGKIGRRVYYKKSDVIAATSIL
mgnify:CR=1 FL=1